MTPAKDTESKEMDAVDRIQRAWTDIHPDFDVSSIGIVSRIWRIGRHLSEHRNAILDTFDADTIIVDVLAELRRSGEPYELTVGDLRKVSRLTSGGVSQRLSRLEGLGLIIRTTDETDRRVVNVRLTDTGIRLIDDIVAEITKREADLLAGMPDDERRQLEELLKKMLGLFE